MKRLRRKFLRETQRLRLELEGLIEAEKLDYKNLDIVTFAERVLAVKPFSYQVNLLRDSSKRLVAVMGRQSGKTTTIAIKAIYFALANDAVTILITSPSLRQSIIMFSRISGFVFASPLRSRVIRSTRTIIQFDNRSEIIALPASENLLRGYSAFCIICDEAAFMPEELITNVVFPMISTTDGYAIFLSTPWDKNHFFYKAFMDPNYSVHRVKSSECPLIKSEFLEEMKRNMTEDAYRMEYEAEFVEEANTYFSKELIRECVDPVSDFLSSLEKDVPRGEYYGGCDFGKLEDFSVIAVLKRGGDFLKLVYLYEFPIGTPYSNVIGHLVRANQKFSFRKVQVDQTGIGEPILEELKVQGVPAEGLTFTIKTKEELLSCLKIAMEQKRLKMPYNRRLCEQINEQQYAYSKSGHLQFSHSSGSHDDMLWSLALGVYAATMGREEPSRLVRAF